MISGGASQSRVAFHTVCYVCGCRCSWGFSTTTSIHGILGCLHYVNRTSDRSLLYIQRNRCIDEKRSVEIGAIAGYTGCGYMGGKQEDIIGEERFYIQRIGCGERCQVVIKKSELNLCSIYRERDPNKSMESRSQRVDDSRANKTCLFLE